MGTVAAESGATTGWVRRIVLGRHPWLTLLRVVIWIVVLFFLARYVLLPVRVDGVSMLPTYRERGVNFVNRLAYKFHPPRRGDVVGIKLAGESVMLMKRIIALPGETLEFREGRVFIDGQVLPEPYLKFPCNWETPPLKIEWDEYYVVGDNRSMDFHLHTQGRALRNKIIGKVLL